MQRRTLVLLPLALVFAFAVRAERPPQSHDDASLVVVGTVQKMVTKTEKFGGDGVMTHYTADIKVGKVDRGTDAKVGETLKVKWFHVTKKPTEMGFVGAFGHAYPLVKNKAKAKFYLIKEGDDGWTVIYNSKGVEKAKKK